jgi:uncharacterized protein (TIGR03437 family)
MRRLTAILLLSASGALAQQIRLVEFVRGLASPVDIQHAGDASNRLFVVEQRGRIRIVKNGALVPAPFLDIVSRIRCANSGCGEQGLLGLAFPPGFATKKYFYVNYTDLLGDTVIARYRVTENPDLADPASGTVILTIDQPYDNHNGGGLAFGPDGYLYIGMGDGGSGGDPQNHAQNPNSLLGKMLRIDVENTGGAPYRIPADNPFAQSAGYRGEIWALGLRNPWRYSFDRQTGDLYIGDVGQSSWEEVSFQPASSRGGENYGWRRMEGAHCFNPASGCPQEGLTLPVVEYSQSAGDCSVTGGYVYRGARFPNLQGTYIYGDYCSGRIWGLTRDQSGWRNSLLLDSTINITAFGQDEAGNLFVTDHGGGRVFLIGGGPPVFPAAGIVNAAYSGGIVPGSIATLFGLNVTNLNGIASAPGFPLPRALNNVSITLNGVAAPLFAVAGIGASEQINFQVPEELAGASTASVIVRNNGVDSAPVEINLSSSAPGIFTFDGTDAAVRHANGQPVSAANPADRNEVVSLFLTGLGPVDRPPGSGNPAPSSPAARTLAAPLATVAGRAATVEFSGLAPGFAGLYQVNLRIPADAPSGSQELRIGGSAAARIAVR